MCVVHVGRVDDDWKFITRLFLNSSTYPVVTRAWGAVTQFKVTSVRYQRSYGFQSKVETGDHYISCLKLPAGHVFSLCNLEVLVSDPPLLGFVVGSSPCNTGSIQVGHQQCIMQTFYECRHLPYYCKT